MVCLQAMGVAWPEGAQPRPCHPVPEAMETQRCGPGSFQSLERVPTPKNTQPAQ